MAAKRTTEGRIRDAGATQKRILAAAKQEFARKGLGGARVDVIAERAKANKRMIYHYFHSKEALFQRVLEQAYVDIRNAEEKLDLDALPPRDALEKLVAFTWRYYLDNPESLTLLNTENLHKARHLKTSDVAQVVNRRVIDMVARLLRRGARAGVFRAGIDPVQLYITIAAIGYFYLTNRYTGAIVYEREMMTQAALDERMRFNIETVARFVCLPQGLLTGESGEKR
jgi:AcrR family transcriptional regulator